MGLDNKRQHDRHPANLEVGFVASGTRFKARSRDISLGGMYVETDHPLPYGTQFQVEIRLPSLTAPAVIEATVRWTGPDGMGIQWGSLRARETWAINQLVKR